MEPSTLELVEFGELLAAPPDQPLAEYGSRRIRVRAYASGMMGAGTCAFSPVPGDGWLNPCGGAHRVLVAAPGDDEGMRAMVPPHLPIAGIPMETWVDVVGHFDDPAARSCAAQGADGGSVQDDEIVEACRSLFVIDIITPAE